MNMSFGEAFAFYFKTILDLTAYLSLFIVALGFVFYLWPKSFNKKEIIKLSAIAVGGIVVMIALSSLTFAISRSTSISFFFNAIIPIIVLAFSLIFSDGNWLHKILKTLILVSSIAVSEVLSKYAGYLVGTISSDSFFLVVLSRSLPNLSFLVTCVLINKINISRYKTLGVEMIWIISSLSLLLIVTSILEHSYETKDELVCILLSVLDIILLAILDTMYLATYKNIEYRHKITNLEVQKTLEEADRMSIIIDQTNREELAKIRHDLKNQLSYVNVLLQQNNIEEASKYIDNFIDNQKVLNSFSCSNSVINSIINLELTKAKFNDVKIEVKVVLPPRIPFDDADIVSLLTNMIDNAIENVDKSKNDPILVQIVKQNDFIRFSTSNKVDLSQVNIKNLTKTKKTGRGHGYGTKIIKNIVSKYNGYVDFILEEDNFICDALLNLDNNANINNK